ncbi:hypothetical protein HDU93_008372, partial [Gonapodya sp. JEL0774]
GQQLLDSIRTGTLQIQSTAAAHTSRKGPEPPKPCVDCGLALTELPEPKVKNPEDEDQEDHPISDVVVRCAVCKNGHHAYCAELYEPALLAKLVTYPWQCNDCKLCVVCREAGDESKLLMCDDCDRGYHTYCLDSKLDQLPEVCGKVYAPDNNDVQMVCCDVCDRWVHVDCDAELTPEKYEKLAEDPNAKYACPLHSPKAERVLSSEMAKGVFKKRYYDYKGKKTFLPPAAIPPTGSTVS